MLHTRFHATGKHWLLVRMTAITAALAGMVPVHGQQLQSPTTAAQKSTSGQTSSIKNDPNAEATIQDSGITFRLRVNLVQVHVVVRDVNGNPVGNLKPEDFQLYDQGKLQPISLFSVETRETRRETAEAAALTHSTEMDQTNGSKTVLPDRFIALFFDDSHLSLEDARYARTGVAKFLDSLAPTDRVGPFTASQLLRGGLTVKSSFDLKPGKYLVRQVIRDSEGSQMAARNGAVEIPE